MNKQYDLSFDEGTLNAIVNALVEQPYKISAPVLNAIQQQINAHLQAEETPTASPDADKEGK